MTDSKTYFIIITLLDNDFYTPLMMAGTALCEMNFFREYASEVLRDEPTNSGGAVCLRSGTLHSIASELIDVCSRANDFFKGRMPEDSKKYIAESLRVYITDETKAFGFFNSIFADYGGCGASIPPYIKSLRSLAWADGNSEYLVICSNVDTCDYRVV